MKHLVGLGITGLISGALSAWAVWGNTKGGGDEIGGLMAAGFIFGLAIGIYALLTHTMVGKGHWWRFILWVVVSGVINVLIILMGMLIMIMGQYYFFLGSAMGAYLVFMALWLIFYLPLRSGLIIFLAGLLLGLPWFLWGDDEPGWWLPLIIWHTGMGLVIGYLVDVARKTRLNV